MARTRKPGWWEIPKPPGKRHYDDDQLRQEVGEILKELPLYHPARREHAKGLASTIEITHLVPPEMVAPIMAAYRAFDQRILEKSKGNMTSISTLPPQYGDH